MEKMSYILMTHFNKYLEIKLLTYKKKCYW